MTYVVDCLDLRVGLNVNHRHTGTCSELEKPEVKGVNSGKVVSLSNFSGIFRNVLNKDLIVKTIS